MPQCDTSPLTDVPQDGTLKGGLWPAHTPRTYLRQVDGCLLANACLADLLQM
jgi:hypothetical protein